ncbi:MAG: hypothetical protein ACSHWT_00365 [Glaciecola sp.]
MINGVLKVNVRSAVAALYLAHWNVDCTDGKKTNDKNFRLHLRNYQEI